MTPIAVYDTTSGWQPIPGLTAWVEGLGLDPRLIYRLEIHQGRARVFEYVMNEQGRKRLLPDGPEKREPYDVAITSLPPGVSA